jgi:hypothetical protein
MLGKTFAELYDEWYQFEYKRLSQQNGAMPSGEEQTKLSRTFKKGIVTQVDISPKGNYAGVVTNNQGKVKVWLVNLETGRKKVIYREGYRRRGDMFDYNYPLLGWNPRQDILTVIIESKSMPFYFHYDLEKKKRSDKQVIPRVDRILSFNYSPNGQVAAMSVVRKGQTDVFTFDFRTQQIRPLTDDIYDDLEPRFVHNGKGIVFTSNRPGTDLLRVGSNRNYNFNSNYDIFYFPDYYGRVLKRLSNSPYNETMPDAYDTTYFSYLTDENGIENRNAVKLESYFSHIQVTSTWKDTTKHKNDTFYFYKNDLAAIKLPYNLQTDTGLLSLDTVVIYKDTLYTYPLTDYKENIGSYFIKPKSHSLYELFKHDDRYYLYKENLPANILSQKVNRGKGAGYVHKESPAPAIPAPQPAPVRRPSSLSSAIRDSLKKDSISKAEGYFQSDFPIPPAEKAEMERQDNISLLFGKRDNGKLKLPTPIPYSLSFIPDQLITQLDNGLINSPYVPYNPNDQSAIYNPVLNGMFKLGMSDMFKDYRLVGGFRVLATLRGAEYFMTYDNVKSRLDKRLMFYRRGETKDLTPVDQYRTTSDELRGELRWPFSEVASIRGSAFGRLDKITYLTGELASLNKPDEATYWTGTKLEYVYDNTIPQGMNLYNGVRLKFYNEFFDALNKEKTLFTVIGTDVRTYTKISRQIIWANRFAAASSIGTAKVVYFLGGVDNWLLPEFNNQNLVDPNQNYVYKAQATNLRGFDQNVRNGNSYAVINSELRVPVFKYIFNRPFRSAFFENFQTLGFLDVGSAWNGLNPLASENSDNKRIIQQGALKITVISQRDPIVYGYGFGFRSVLLGYFIRVDYAWGVEDGLRTDRKVYASLGLDF